MTATRRDDTGNHALASFRSQSRTVEGLAGARERWTWEYRTVDDAYTLGEPYTCDTDKRLDSKDFSVPSGDQLQKKE